MVEKKDLKKVPLEEKPQALRELIQAREKELQKLKKELDESQEQLAQEDEHLFEEAHLKSLEEEVKKKDSSKNEQKPLPLYHAEPTIQPEKIEKTPSELELLTRGAPELPPEIVHSAYITQLSQQPAQQLYSEVNAIHEQVQQRGYMNPQEEQRIVYLVSAAEQKQEAIEQGRYKEVSESAAQKASVAKSLGKQMLSYSTPHHQ